MGSSRPDSSPSPARRASALAAVLAGCWLVATLVLGLQAWFDIEKRQQEATAELVQARVGLLAGALWDIDVPVVQRQVDELARHPLVLGVELTTPGGQVFRAGMPLSPGRADWTGPVSAPQSGGRPLGTLAIDFDRTQAASDLVLRVLVVAAVLAICFGGAGWAAGRLRGRAPVAEVRNPAPGEAAALAWAAERDELRRALDQLESELQASRDETARLKLELASLARRRQPAAPAA